MPRLTPQELRQRKEAKKREREEEVRQSEARLRASDLEKREKARQLEEKKESAKRQKESLDRLESAILALYLEIDKLNKKAPAMTISQLTLERVNKAIKSGKELMQDQSDDFISEITEFIAAGDMPQYRDVTLVLSVFCK